MTEISPIPRTRTQPYAHKAFRTKAFFFDSPHLVFPYVNARCTKSSLVCHMSSQREVIECVCSCLSASVCIYQVHIRIFMYTLKTRLKLHRFLRVCFCVTIKRICVCIYTVCGDKPLHCRYSRSLKHPLVSHMLPSLLRAWLGSAASTKYGVVDTVPYGVF